MKNINMKTITHFEHFINENNDVLVSETVVPEDYYSVPNFDPFTIAQILINDSLYIIAKCYSLVVKNDSETESMAIKKWLTSNGFKFDDNYYFNLTENVKKIGYYKEYNMLSLACLYGGNSRSFRLIKPFIVPKEYIQDCFNNNNYVTGKINKFIEKLKSDGYIEYKFRNK